MGPLAKKLGAGAYFILAATASATAQNVSKQPENPSRNNPGHIAIFPRTQISIQGYNKSDFVVTLSGPALTDYKEYLKQNGINVGGDSTLDALNSDNPKIQGI